MKDFNINLRCENWWFTFKVSPKLLLLSGEKKILFLRRILVGSRHETVEMIGGKNRNG